MGLKPLGEGFVIVEAVGRRCCGARVGMALEVRSSSLGMVSLFLLILVLMISLGRVLLMFLWLVGDGEADGEGE